MWAACAVCLAHSASLSILTEVATVQENPLVSRQLSTIIQIMKLSVWRYNLFNSQFILPLVVGTVLNMFCDYIG